MRPEYAELILTKNLRGLESVEGIFQREEGSEA